MYLKPIPTTEPQPQTLGQLPELRSASATMRVMRDMIRNGRKDARVRQQAEMLITHLRHKAYAQQARECFEFVRDTIQYVRDPRDVERIQTPDALLQSRKGDCDDKVVLLCSLLESIGHPTKLIAVGLWNGPLSHVYCATKIGPNWIPCETTEPWPMGREPRTGVTSRYQLDI